MENKKDERVGEKMRFQFPPRVNTPHHFYDKSSGFKIRKERGTKDVNHRYSITKE
jgi:hypothetical protein